MTQLLTHRSFPIAIAFVAALLLAAACSSSNTDAPESPTPEPSPTVAVPAVANPTTASSTATPSSSVNTPIPATTIPPTPASAPARDDSPPDPAVDRIAFTSTDGVIYTAKSDGTDRQRVSFLDETRRRSPLDPFFSWPVWSPDGRYLLTTAFAPDSTGRFVSSLLRTAATPGSEPLLLFSDIPGSSGIGGIAHFPVWRPDGSAVTLIANDGDGLSTYLIDVDDRSAQIVSDGAPVYAEWSRDGAHLLVHTLDELVLHDFDPSGTRTRQGVIGTGSISYRVARFSPVSNDYLYVNTDMDLSGLYKGNPTSNGTEFIANVRDGSAFSWAPQDERVAFADANRLGFYQTLSVIDLAGDAEDVTVTAPIFAFWWSPDGEKILLAVLGDGPGNIGLVVMNSRTGDVDVLGLIEPSEEMNFALSFFDQYAVDQQLWSPDSTSFVFSGILGEGLADEVAGRPVQFGAVEPSVWVIDASGARPPISLGVGTFATWSPG